MGERAGAQDCVKWDELLARLGWKMWNPESSCKLPAVIGSDSIDHFRQGHAPCHVQPGRLIDVLCRSRCGAGVSVFPWEEILCESTDAPRPATHLDDEGTISRSGPIPFPSIVKARGSTGRPATRRRPRPRRPRRPRWPAAASVSLRRDGELKPVPREPSKMAVDTATPVCGPTPLKDGTRARARYCARERTKPRADPIN